MSDWLAWIGGEKGQLAMAGALGGLVRWLTLRDHWSDGLISVTVGAICAMHVGPLAIPLLEPVVGRLGSEASAGTLSGFLIGIGGITLSGFLIDVWRARRAQLRQSKDGGDK